MYCTQFGAGPVMRQKMRTSNIERPTSNIEVKTGSPHPTSMFDVGRWMFDVRISSFIPATFLPPAHINFWDVAEPLFS